MSIPTFVLLPGLDGTGDLFDPFVAALPTGSRSTVVRYTSPAQGTYAECRAVALERLPRNEPYVLVGESFSGPIAISIAATNPPGLRGLVLVASFVSSPRRMLTWLSPLIRFIPTHSAPGWITDFLLTGRFATPDLRARIASAMGQITPAIARERLREIGMTNNSAELARMQVPVLYVRAAHDRLVPRSCGERVASLAPLTKVVDVEAPHMVLQCAPRECAKAICTFARE